MTTTLTDELGMVMIETEDATPAPVTVPAGEDPWPVLRAMQRFMPGTPRGECEIIQGCGPDHPPSKLTIGYAILLGHPERIAQPVFDCRTRIVEVVELGDWLKARGYEASACQWDEPQDTGFRHGNAAMTKPEKAQWRLITGKAQLPPLPSTAPSPGTIVAMALHQRDLQAAFSLGLGQTAAAPAPPDLFANAKAMLKGR